MSIEQQALQTYKNNIDYLKEKYPNVHKKLELLETIIQTGQYQEKYALDYKEEGYFDIQELATGDYLYNENSITHAKAMADTVTLKRKGGMFKALRINELTDEQTKQIDNSELSFHNALWATATVTHYTSKYTDANSLMQRVNKIIFIDLGLGLHLSAVIDKLKPQVIFIKEPNLETFRLSLFVTDYKTLCEKYFVYFSITDDEGEENKNFLEFLNKGNNYNLHLKHIPFSKDYSSSLRRLQSHVFMQSYINYGYSAELLRFITSPLYLTQGYSYLNISRIYKNSFFSTKPLLLLFSGPSTAKHIEWIQTNRDKFIVVSALSTCRLLKNFDLAPDIVIHIDPGTGTAALFNGIEKEYFKNTIALLASNVNEDTIGRFEPSSIHLIEQGTRYKKGFGMLSAPSVGEYTYALSLILGATNVFLLGIDLALDSETLATHGSFHKSRKRGVIDDDKTSLDPKKSVEYIKGNLREKVPTTPGFKISIGQFNGFAQEFKKEEHTIYNLSDGAYLEGTIPLEIDAYDWDSLELLNNIEIQKNLNSFLNEISEAEFNDADKTQIKYQIKEAKKLEKIIKQYQKKRFANSEAYLNSLSATAWGLSDMENKTKSNLAEVYYQYFPIIQSYIFNLFNTQNLENSNKHVTQIHSILTKQLLKISRLYIKEIEKYLK